MKAECLTIEPGTALNPAFLKSSDDQFENFDLTLSRQTEGPQ